MRVKDMMGINMGKLRLLVLSLSCRLVKPGQGREVVKLV